MERDIAGVKLINALYDFNSHAHVERDIGVNANFNMKRISTHTLTWSVTLDTLEKSAKTEFQLTRSRGA